MLNLKNIFSIFLVLLIIQYNTIKPAHAEIDWSQVIIDSFESLGSNIDDIPEKTEGYNHNNWYEYSVADVTLVGGGACAIPGVGLLALPAEFAYLMREMHNSVLGLGYLMYGSIYEEDFSIIMALWSEEYSLDDNTVSEIYNFSVDVTQEFGEHIGEEALKNAWEYYKKNKKSANTSFAASAAGAKAVDKTTAKASSKLASKMIAKKVGVKTVTKLSPKVAAKVGAKVGAKYAGKGLAIWFPFVSAGVCAGANAWIMNDIMDTAWNYYSSKTSVRQKIINE